MVLQDYSALIINHHLDMGQSISGELQQMADIQDDVYFLPIDVCKVQLAIIPAIIVVVISISVLQPRKLIVVGLTFVQSRVME